ncbi:MAG: ferritin family protein [Candidatus Aminicenantes bacterium]|nr:ferritin family protein [Candidatus Aminicenantes bacterium]
MITADMKAMDILALAIKSEIEAAKFYRKLARKIKAEFLKKKILFLALEEKKHQAILRRLSRQRFGTAPSIFPEQGIEPGFKVTSTKGLKVAELFKLALEAEKAAEAFYRQGREKVEDSQAQHILNYLSRVERSHAALIKSEMDLIERFPEGYDVAAFHLGDELMHIGP